MEQSRALRRAHFKFLTRRIHRYNKMVELFFFYTTKLSYVAIVTGTDSYFSELDRKDLGVGECSRQCDGELHRYLGPLSTPACSGPTLMRVEVK